VIVAGKPALVYHRAGAMATGDQQGDADSGDAGKAPTAGFVPHFEPRDFGAWRARAEAEGYDPASLRVRITPRFAAEPLYTSAEATVPEPARGRTRSGAWLVCQELDDPRMDVCGDDVREALQGGVEALWIRTGLDHGTRVLTAGDLDPLLKHADLAAVPVFLETEGDALPLGLSYAAYARSREVAFEDLRGCLGADPLGALARCGNLGAGLRGARRDMVALVQWCRANAPKLRGGLVSTRAYHDAGATPVQEIAWALATGLDYLRWLFDAGLRVDAAAEQLVFSVGVTGDLFPQIAKLRALRLAWAKVVTACTGERGAETMHLHARTSYATRTRRDPWVNMLRGTAETFAAAVGGADSIACACFDETLGPPDALARRVARNTQLVLRDESHLAQVDDPAGGAWLLETLTDHLAREAWSLFQEIQEGGGMVEALRHGKISGALDAQRHGRDAAAADRSRVIVGVSEYADPAEQLLERPKISLKDVEVELGNPFGEADPEARHRALLALAETLRDRKEAEDVAAHVFAAAEVGVDLFSLGAVLRAGRASLHIEPLVPHRPAAAWEALRDAADAHRKRTGAAPKIVLVALGDTKAITPRVDWVRGLLAAGGLEPFELTLDSVDKPALREAIETSGTRAAVVCATDERNGADGEELARALRGAGAGYVVFAGKPGDAEDALRSSGVGDFVYRGSDLLAVLERAHEASSQAGTQR